MKNKEKITNHYLLFIFSFSFTALSQTCKTTTITATTPTVDFTVNNNGTVTHDKTGLTWQVCSQGQTWVNNTCTGTAITHTWQAALQIPQTLNVSGGYANKTDWRLPNTKELSSITELQCFSPSINSTVFPSTPSSSYWSSYWSSSPYANDSRYAWIVDFSNGNDYGNNRYRSGRVRLVSGGQ